MADTDPAPDPQAPPKAAPLEDRVGAIETEQQRQGGILTRIEGLLTGPKDPTGGTAPGSSPTPNDGGGLSVADQVRKGVEEIEAKKKAKADAQAAKDADAAWRKTVEDHVAEHRPAEPRTGRKIKLQERLFGKADAR